MRRGEKKVDKNIKIFSGTSGCRLADKVAKKLNLPLGKSKILKFQDGEYYTKIDETIRGADVFVVQSTSPPVNQNLMGLLIFIDALKRASAKTINVIIPYYGYARQDRKASPREPITSKLAANLLATAGATRIVTMDLHANQIQGFFDIPVDHLEGLPLIANSFIDHNLSGEEMVVVAPNPSGVKKARKLAEWLDCKMAIIDRRQEDDQPETLDLIGDVKGKRVILIDGIIDTGDTVVRGAEAVMEKGATEVYAACTHGVFSGDATKRIEDSPLKRVFITDSIYLTEEKRPEKIEILSADTLFAETLKRIINNQSLMSLLEK
ncbi:ribose-phosphate diphosphokinase [Propionigenium maris]|uniref:ribose-phosphate diphosphokinase n=1 Tax=Propionigenium maris TaxID=45622 RepID=UPI0024906B19|nr:ribose-phosphate pyrophosphokinase [Propionigenium maris]